MRIGFFTSVKGWGGSETYLRDLILVVREHGHEAILFGVEGTRLIDELHAVGIQCIAWTNGMQGASPFTCRDGLRRNEWRTGRNVEPEGGRTVGCECGNNRKELETAFRVEDAEDKERRWGLKQEMLRMVPGWVRLFAGNIREVLQLERIFRQHPVDVMHVNIHGYECAGVSCRRCGIPSLGVFHTWPVNEVSRVRRFLIRITARSYTRRCSVSMACARAWEVACHLSPGSVDTVRNGIDVHRFSAHDHSLTASGPFQVLSAGRLHPMKGYEVLITALSLLPNRDIRVVIAGSGNLEGTLRSLTRRLGVTDRVVFPGYVEDMASLYRQSHCFALPSVSHESFGLSVAEAMASGLPVITSDFGPLPEINVDGVTGLVVPVRNAGALAEAITRLMTDAEMRRRMGEAGRQRASTLFSHRRMVAETFSLYETVLTENALPKTSR